LASTGRGTEWEKGSKQFASSKAILSLKTMKGCAMRSQIFLCNKNDNLRSKQLQDNYVQPSAVFGCTGQLLRPENVLSKWLREMAASIEEQQYIYIHIYPPASKCPAGISLLPLYIYLCNNPTIPK
jgi:hypothetical protein